MSSNIKTIDEPFFPLSPNPTKRNTNHCRYFRYFDAIHYFVMKEYFDDTLKNSARASKIIGVPALGMIPKMILDPVLIYLSFSKG
jgi:capsular polysaccharide biosynthesis protein